MLRGSLFISWHWSGFCILTDVLVQMAAAQCCSLLFGGGWQSPGCFVLVAQGLLTGVCLHDLPAGWALAVISASALPETARMP